MEFILTHPLTALIVTIGTFAFATWLQKKCGGYSLINPTIIAIILVSAFIVMGGINYQQYLQDAYLINALLEPVTVAFAIPLYKQLKVIGRQMSAAFTAVVVALIISASVAWLLAIWLGADEQIQLAIIPKSVTTPIAVGIGNEIGAVPSLVVFFVFTTGILGSLFGMFIFKLLRIKDERAIGFSLGATCHGLGVARAFEHSEKTGSFSVLGMVLMGLIAGIITPLVVLALL